MFSLYDIPLLTELVLGVARFIYKHIAPTELKYLCFLTLN